jgi:hypothetical protein
VRPKDLFPDGRDSVEVDGVEVRKGSIRAFIYNALALERLDPRSDDYRRAAAELRELVPTLEAVRVFDVFGLRSDRVAEIVAQPSRSSNATSST